MLFVLCSVPCKDFEFTFFWCFLLFDVTSIQEVQIHGKKNVFSVVQMRSQWLTGKLSNGQTHFEGHCRNCIAMVFCSGADFAAAFWEVHLLKRKHYFVVCAHALKFRGLGWFPRFSFVYILGSQEVGPVFRFVCLI